MRTFLTLVPIALFTLPLTACGDATSPRPGCEDHLLLTPMVTPLPSSTHHSPTGTWWGYNMSKIIRDGPRTYIAGVRGDESLQPTASPRTNARCTLFARDDSTPTFTEAASVPCSRPANVLLGPDGAVHLIAFEATDPTQNDSLGSLWHYTWPHARAGDLSTLNRRPIIAHTPGAPDRANIRVGAAIAPTGHIAVAYGLPWVAETGTPAVLLQRFDPTADAWSETLVAPVDHEFYYPFVAFGPDGDVLSLHIMDDYNVADGQVFNTYYRVDLFRFAPDDPSDHDAQVIVDLTPLAPSFPGRHALLETSDLFIDASGTLHILYKEFLNPGDDHGTSAFVHCAGPRHDLTCTSHRAWVRNGINWARLFELDGQLYALLSAWSRHYLAHLPSGALRRLPINVPAGTYLYLAAPRSGSRDLDTRVDAFLVSGAASAYPNAEAHHIALDPQQIRCQF